ncbi:MAG: hypothetical protein AB1744_10750 [Candidatus Zixiibacteriota bacterium]
MDIRACISCCEDMKAWQELEAQLSHCGGELSLWAPREDSLDVAEAMRLEGLHTPVRVLRDDAIDALGWRKRPTPIKVLLDDRCQPRQEIGPVSKAESRRFLERLLEEIRSLQ